MPKARLQPPAAFSFTTQIPVRITDVNYGGHVGNDSILSILHEARVQYLASYGYTEMNFGGAGMIMRDVTIEFKNELFYGDQIIASVTCTAISNVAFELFYKLERNSGDSVLELVYAKTGMVCYDYSRKKIVAISQEVRSKISPL